MIMPVSENYTLKTIAARLKIHVSTVSRVLGGDDGVARKAASPDTIQKIRSLASELGYVPNPHAKSLRTRQSYLIGVTVPRLSDYVWAAIYEGIEETALAKGYAAYVTNSYDKGELREKQMAIAVARHVDGLILGDIHTSKESSDFLASLPLPFVLALRYVGDFLSVTCDDKEGGRLVAEHLFSRGHRDVAILSGLAFTSTGRDRSVGFVEYFKEAGYPISPDRILHSNFDTESGRRCAKALLHDNSGLTAIYAVNDFAAIGAMGAVREAGLVAGVSIAVVGYNDTPLAGPLPIPLTTVRNPIRQVGEKAMELLFQRMAGETCKSIVLKPQLIERESSNFVVPGR